MFAFLSFLFYHFFFLHCLDLLSLYNPSIGTVAKSGHDGLVFSIDLLENESTMDSRHRMMATSTASFSIIAQEALDHIAADSDNEDTGSQEHGVVSHQRSRRRLRVSLLH